MIVRIRALEFSVSFTGRPNGKLFGFSISTIESPQNRRQNRSNRYFSFVNLLRAIQFSIIPKNESTFICSIGTRKFIRATEIRLKDRNIGRMIVQNRSVLYNILYYKRLFKIFSFNNDIVKIFSFLVTVPHFILFK